MDALHDAIEPRALVLHRDSRCAALTWVGAAAARSKNGLRLSYALQGDMSALVLPARAASERRDELWRSTCFEVFVRASNGAGYLELNVAPSGAWAAYEFSGYRQGMRNAAVSAPVLHQVRDAASMNLVVELTQGQLAGLPSEVPWTIALSVVIEETSGAKSYWALAHPPGKPDFHHAAGFVLELP